MLVAPALPRRGLTIEGALKIVEELQERNAKAKEAHYLNEQRSRDGP